MIPDKLAAHQSCASTGVKDKILFCSDTDNLVDDEIRLVEVYAVHFLFVSFGCHVRVEMTDPILFRIVLQE